MVVEAPAVGRRRCQGCDGDGEIETWKVERFLGDIGVDNSKPPELVDSDSDGEKIGSGKSHGTKKVARNKMKRRASSHLCSP